MGRNFWSEMIKVHIGHWGLVGTVLWDYSPTLWYLCRLIFLNEFCIICTKKGTLTIINLSRAGFRRGQSGQLPRGPHKKGAPQISIMLFFFLLCLVYEVCKLRKISKFSKLARTQRYSRLFGFVGNFRW